MSSFIVLTIGPVQSYISQARRTQDLWQGSRILSFLASKGVHHVMEAYPSEAEIIYPAISLQDTDNIPNRIVVRWHGDTEGASRCAADMAQAIRAAWKTVSSNTMRYFIEKVEQGERDTVSRIWERQEANWLECYWVVIPENPASYGETMREANDAMGARKLLRNFAPLAEPGRKCSITGEHEALHGGKHDYAGFWKQRRETSRNLAQFGKHERLSAISTIKRLAHEEEASNDALQFPNRFPSTSSIAAAPFRYSILQALDDRPDTRHLTPDVQRDVAAKRKLLKRELANFITTLLKLFNKPEDLFFVKKGRYNEEYFPYLEIENVGNQPNAHLITSKTLQDNLVRQFRSIDGDFLFEDTLIARTVEEYSQRPPTPAALKAAQNALKAFLDAAHELGIGKPQPYLVILSMDGDHMGGTLGELKDSVQHQKFSRTLANFARHDVLQIVEQAHLGRVVYAGGDDVLALVPVVEALEIAEALRVAFASSIESAKILNQKGDHISVHASTGLAFVHHTHNLQDAVQVANSAQKTIAKEQLGRNAIGVRLLRRSGEPRSMGHAWELAGKSIVNHVNAIVEAFGKDGALSRNLPYDVGRMVYSMAGNIVPEPARVAEMRRILRRRLGKPSQDDLETVLGHIIALAGATELGWKSVQPWLELARFIAQKDGDR